jgi:hypothetical protein
VDQFHGIEIEEWPARIAEVALWLTDHQMNLKVSEEFGLYFARLPLKKAPHIVHGNALRIDWQDVVPSWKLSYLLGNPPFVGSKMLSDEQRREMETIFSGTKGFGVLDYVACWYRKAAEYMAAENLLAKVLNNPEDNVSGGAHICAAFVSTNSITQGEQVGILWPDLLRRGIKIHFAHRTFQWNSEARGKAAVHCIIIGFGLQDVEQKWLFDYDTPKSEPHAVKAHNINPYLVDGPDVVLYKQITPLCNVVEMTKGSQPTDAGYLLMNDAEKAEMCKLESKSVQWIRKFVGADEFINGINRWCLWLKDCPPEVLRSMPEVIKRIEGVRQTRLASKKAATREWALKPTLFTEDRQPDNTYLLVPSVSSERRNYIPVGFMPPEIIASNLVLTIPNATPYHFGILCSTMHNAWMRAVCGRLKSDYRYSAGIVYNNFPWPEATEKQQATIENAAQGVLDARAKFPDSTLADLYDPLTMPPELVKAHQQLDRAVDAAYGKTGFKTEAERVAFLFQRYQQLTAPLALVNKSPKRKVRNT